MVHILLQVLSQFLELLSRIWIILAFGLDLLSHVHLVKSDDWLLELFVVCDVVQGVVHLVLKLLLLFLLTLEDLAQITVLTDQSPHSHSQILDNQTQIHKDSLEVSLLLLHLIGLLLQFIDCVAPRSNVPLQFLDLVIKHELELLKLLSFFLQIMDSLVFITDCGLPLWQLQSLTLNVGLKLVKSGNEFVELGLLVLDIGSEPFLLTLLCFVLLGDRCEITFMFYTSFDNFDQFFFVLVFDHVDFLPGFVLNLFPRFFINFQQMVDLSLQLFTLSVFLLLLESLVDFELFERFLL